MRDSDLGEVGPSRSAGVRTAWPLSVLIVGLVLFVFGAWTIHHVGAVGGYCDLAPDAQGCSRTAFDQHAAMFSMIAGFVLALVGACFGFLRGVQWVAAGRQSRSTSS